MTFSSDGRRLIAGRQGGEISVVDIAERKFVRQFAKQGGEIKQIAPNRKALGFSTIARNSPGRSDGLSVWGVNGQEPIELEHAADSQSAWPEALSRDGRMIALTGWSGENLPDDNVFIYDSTTKRRRCGLRVNHGAGRIVFSPDNLHLLCMTRFENAIEMWDLEKSERLWSRHDGRVEKLPVGSFRTDSSRYCACMFGPSERDFMYAIGGGWTEDVDVCINDVKSGEHRIVFTCRGETIALSPNGRWLASGGTTNVIEVWDAQTAHRVGILPGPFERVWCLEFSPDSRLLAWGEEDGTISVAEMTPRERLIRAAIKEGPVQSACPPISVAPGEK